LKRIAKCPSRQVPVGIKPPYPFGSNNFFCRFLDRCKAKGRIARPPTQAGFLSEAGSAQPDLERQADGVRAQDRKNRDMAVLGQVAQVGKIAILPSTIHPGSQIPASITPASRLLVTQ
jgi:hypothetical protein